MKAKEDFTEVRFAANLTAKKIKEKKVEEGRHPFHVFHFGFVFIPVLILVLILILNLIVILVTTMNFIVCISS
jgi:hypothetical protein